MEITIHIGSMLFGFFLGYVAIATIGIFALFSGKYDRGWSDGWKCAMIHERRKKEEEIG